MADDSIDARLEGLEGRLQATMDKLSALRGLAEALLPEELTPEALTPEARPGSVRPERAVAPPPNIVWRGKMYWMYQVIDLVENGVPGWFRSRLSTPPAGTNFHTEYEEKQLRISKVSRLEWRHEAAPLADILEGVRARYLEDPETFYRRQRGLGDASILVEPPTELLF